MAVGTRDNPIAIGSRAAVGDWVISVESVLPNANEVVSNENQFNDPPAAGNQFFIARVAATYIGEESAPFWLELDNKLVGSSNVAYEGIDAYCGVIPDDPTETGEVFPGGTVSANLCWSISEADAESVLLILEPSFSFEDAERAFFGLQPGVGSETELAIPTVDPLPAGGEVGSRGNPIELGSTGRVGDWMLRVVGMTPNANEAVAEENQFNDPPGEGHQFFIVELEATYVGASSGHVSRNIRSRVLGELNVARDTFDAYCGVFPDPISDAGEAFPDGTVTGNECWSVATTEVDSLMLMVEDSSIFDGSSRTFFALR